MSRYTVDRGIVRRTSGEIKDGMRSEVAWNTYKLCRSPLDTALEEARVPSLDELADDAKCLIGAAQIALRGSEDVHKVSKSIANLVGCVAQLDRIARGENVDEALSNLSEEDMFALLKPHFQEIMDGLSKNEDSGAPAKK